MDQNQASSSSKCLYSILGVDNTCPSLEIRAAYRKLAMKWHPDKCSRSDDRAIAKTKFQEIQDAYAVLSDDNKRLLYDLGLYNKQDDEGMQSFMGEMANMMSATSSKSSFDELQEMFNQMVDSYLPENLRACSSSSNARFSSSSQPLYESQSFCIGVEDCSNQSFCIGKPDSEQLTKQRFQKKAPKRRKCQASRS